MGALQKTLIVAFVVLAAAFWNWRIYLDGFYCENGAKTASIAEGRIYLENVCHGGEVFLTEKEKFNFDVLYPSIAIGSVLIAGLLDLRWKHFAFKEEGADLFYWFRKNRRR